MKKTFNYFMLLSAASIIISCNNSGKQKHIINYTELEKANWLIGEWQNNSAEGNNTEVWERENDSVFSGKSYYVIGKDTVSSETIRLEQNGKTLFYIPTVNEQNNRQAIKFALTSSTIKQLVFENPEHDFPQKITYEQITNDSLLAEISGMKEGKQNSQKFPLARAK